MYRLCVLYKFIHLINKPGRKKNIIWIEFSKFNLLNPCINYTIIFLILYTRNI